VLSSAFPLSVSVAAIKLEDRVRTKVTINIKTAIDVDQEMQALCIVE
jgi:hypothetical protein